MVARLLNGLAVIMVGAVLLMNTTGNLPWSVWDTAIGLWPVFIIAVGLHLLLPKLKIPWLALGVIVILIIAMVNPYPARKPYMNWLWKNYRGFPRVPMFSAPLTGQRDVTVPLNDQCSRLELYLSSPALKVTLKGDSGLNEAPSSAARLHLEWEKHEPSVSTSETDSVVRVQASVPTLPNVGTESWDVSVNPSLETSLDISAGALSADMDFTSVSADLVSVSSGACSANMKFGLSGRTTKIDLRGSAVKLDIVVPEGAGIRLELSGNLPGAKVSFNTPSNRSGNTWISEDYESTATKIDVKVSCTAANINVSRTSK